MLYVGYRGELDPEEGETTPDTLLDGVPVPNGIDVAFVLGYGVELELEIPENEDDTPPDALDVGEEGDEVGNGAVPVSPVPVNEVVLPIGKGADVLGMMELELDVKTPEERRVPVPVPEIDVDELPVGYRTVLDVRTPDEIPVGP